MRHILIAAPIAMPKFIYRHLPSRKAGKIFRERRKDGLSTALP